MIPPSPSALAGQLHTQLDSISSSIDVMFDNPLENGGYIIVDGPIANLLCPPVMPALNFSLELSAKFDAFKVDMTLFGSFEVDLGLFGSVGIDATLSLYGGGYDFLVGVTVPSCPTIDVGAEASLFGLRAGAGATLDCMHGTVDFFADIVIPPVPDIEIICVRQPSVTPFVMEAFGQLEVAKGAVLTAALGAQVA